MKVLVVQDQFEDGGAARVASITCNGLAERGYSIEVCTDNINFEVRYYLDPNIQIFPVAFVPQRRNSISRFLSVFRTAISIRQYIKNSRPDVIIAVQSNSFLRTLIAKVNIDIPLLAADHTSFSRRMDLVNHYTRWHLYKYADGLSILTQRDYKILGDKYPQKRVIYNPLTFEVLNHQSQREKTVLVAGRFDMWKVKGFDIIINIWEELSQKHPDWKLVFAGSGSPNSVNYVKQLTERLIRNDSVSFLGQVKDMKTLYEHTGIFVLPSRVEGFPMVLLEAMSQGCPCIAFSIGGASEEMIESGCGIVVEDGDVLNFKNSLDELLLDDNLRDRFSANSINSVSRFSVDNHLDDWEEMIIGAVKG